MGKGSQMTAVTAAAHCGVSGPGAQDGLPALASETLPGGAGAADSPSCSDPPGTPLSCPCSQLGGGGCHPGGTVELRGLHCHAGLAPFRIKLVSATPSSSRGPGSAVTSVLPGASRTGTHSRAPKDDVRVALSLSPGGPPCPWVASLRQHEGQLVPSSLAPVVT